MKDDAWALVVDAEAMAEQAERVQTRLRIILAEVDLLKLRAEQSRDVAKRHAQEIENSIPEVHEGQESI